MSDDMDLPMAPDDATGSTCRWGGCWEPTVAVRDVLISDPEEIVVPSDVAEFVRISVCAIHAAECDLYDCILTVVEKGPT